jgi:hypothetical protein
MAKRSVPGELELQGGLHGTKRVSSEDGSRKRLRSSEERVTGVCGKGNLGSALGSALQEK